MFSCLDRPFKQTLACFDCISHIRCSVTVQWQETEEKCPSYPWEPRTMGNSWLIVPDSDGGDRTDPHTVSPSPHWVNYYLMKPVEGRKQTREVKRGTMNVYEWGWDWRGRRWWVWYKRRGWRYFIKQAISKTKKGFRGGFKHMIDILNKGTWRL